MRGSTNSYVDLAGLAGVGDLLLDTRPALVLAADGARVLWANAAGVALFGEREMGALLRREITPLNPLREQSARLARVLPVASARIEVLRIGSGFALTLVHAACRRLNLADGGRAVLAVALDAQATPGGTSLTGRAENLVSVLSTGDCLAAVLESHSGKVIASADGFDALLASEPDVDTFVGESRRAGDTTRKTTAARGRAVGTARFIDGDRTLTLVIVGPPGPVAATPLPSEIPTSESPTIDLDVGELPVEMMLPLLDETDEDAEAEYEAVAEIAPAPEPAPPAAPVIRFAWATDSDGRFAASPDELTATVGRATGEIAGFTWPEIAGALALDPDGRITSHFAAGDTFTATVYWPAAATRDRVAVDLSAVPQRDRDGRLVGIRGFGTIRSDDRRKDDAPDARLPERAASATPAEPHAADPAPEIPPPDPSPPDEVPDADRAAQLSIEAGVNAPDSGASNVVRLPGSPVRALPASLSGVENDAFRRIAEVLGNRKTPPSEPSPPPTAQPPALLDTAPNAATSAPPANASPEPPAPNDIDLRLLDRLPIGIAIVRDRRALFVNRALLELLGYANADAFEAAGGADTLFPGRERLAAALPDLGGALRARRADGSSTPVQAWLHAVTFGGSTALMLSLMPADPSGDRDDAIAVALARSEARADELAAILDTATDGVIVIDARGKISSVNHAAEALFGIEGSQYGGRFFTDLLADESQKAALDYLDGLASNGVASVLNDGREVIGRVPQGGLIPLFMTMGRIGTSDKFAAVLRDITHWKNVEEELTAAKRAAEAANQQKSDFLAKISHEIRTPLNAIIGFSEVMMSERFGPIGNPRYRDYLHDIHVSGGHLMSLINDLLDLSKIEAGKLDLSFEAVPVNAVIQETVALMQPQANRERIIIRTSLSTEVPNIVADPRSFRQILLNLLSNAIKFTRAGGQVIVSTTLELSGEVVVRIRDTGIGMTPRDLETAMKPFRQVALSRDDRDHGTGLGLPLTKALVEANRATFAIESAPNEGTLVKVTFPTTRVLAG